MISYFRVVIRPAFVCCLMFALTGCWQAERPYMVAAANKHAAIAARDILAKGGSAVDAAIAVQLILTLVEPQSSGIGGGAYMLHWDKARAQVSAYDGRETAPANASPQLFIGSDGRPMKFFDAAVGGRAVGVPGIIAMLWQAHKAHGKLAWADLFKPAIDLAERGFKVSPVLNKRIRAHARLLTHPSTIKYFFTTSAEDQNKREPLPVGHLLRNPAYAASLRLIAAKGPDGFYRGKIAHAMVKAVHEHNNPGGLALSDLAGYTPKKREALCVPYRAYSVCGMPPSTSGGLTVLQTLRLLAPFPMGTFKPGSLEAVHLITEAGKLAFADRRRYIADPDFVDVPSRGLLDKNYVSARSKLIDPKQANLDPLPGLPPGGNPTKWGMGKSLTQPSTTHFSIVDSDGNAVSMTSSVETAFGAHMMVGGFILNNQLTDFSFRPNWRGKPVANAVEGGKRPRSSMSPTLVFHKDGKLYAVVGSPGGSRIIGYVLKTIIALIDWKLDIQSAINLPHHVTTSGPVQIEADTSLLGISQDLTKLGHAVSVRRLESGLHAIVLIGDKLHGGADPRREGVVMSGVR